MEEIRRLVGLINSFSILCPTLRFLKGPLLNDLKTAINEGFVRLSNQTIQDLKCWFYVLQCNANGFPIPDPMSYPPIFTLKFYTDAAGINCRSLSDSTVINNAGAGAICFDGEKNMILLISCSWPEMFLKGRDRLGKVFGRKSTLLETIAILLPVFFSV